ncbi:glycine cleavage system P-protein-domain-containing protein [Jimgerdemannia flammicorona]|nr:glycine cleavage system P-protein-domain-containing protein [Jimgerdemannia flammicorona]
MFARLIRPVSRPITTAHATRRLVLAATSRPSLGAAIAHRPLTHIKPSRRSHHTDASPTAAGVFAPLDTFARRHLGSQPAEIQAMLKQVGVNTVEELVAKTIPSAIRSPKPLALKEGFSERELLHRLQAIASKNKVYRSYLGMGYTDTVVPNVILRNVLENPAWYTQYTPYQPEISQGRLESLLNFQTMVCDLTGMSIANASLLDEGTAAAEAMLMCFSAAKRDRSTFIVDVSCHPQTIACVQCRAEGFNINVVVGDVRSFDFEAHRKDLCGILIQYPGTDGAVVDYKALTSKIHGYGGQVVVATDLLALTMLKPPGEFGADIALGNSQRFGVPLGYGGPHAAFFAVKDEHKRRMPGRLVGVSKDAAGKTAFRLSLQTREQHIRREKATSNICTAQALLANVAAMYGVYHGPEGVRAIAQRVHNLTAILAAGIRQLGHTIKNDHFFDTLSVNVSGGSSRDVLDKALNLGINLRPIDASTVGVTLDETVTKEDLKDLLKVFATGGAQPADLDALAASLKGSPAFPSSLARTSEYMTHEVFNSHHSETKILRYIHHLQSKDLSLVHSMIPLGSCTMKLNATTEMIPITWPEFANLHPFAPIDQAEGYTIMLNELESDIAEITGFDDVSLQPNSGAQGEYAGLRVIRSYHESRGNGHRNVCLIPISAHGTNPASAAMAGMEVVIVKCDAQGNLDMADLKNKAQKHADKLAAIMITYPSTFGVFESGVAEACEVVHQHGGQVYMDGANLNAQIGLTKPAEIGADVCHLNLHKTFCIPHGGGGPGMGPIAV